MDNTCKACGSNQFTTDSCERICVDCGDVQDEFEDEGRLCMLPDNEAIVDTFRNKNQEANERLTGRIRGETNTTQERRQIGRAKLMDEMRKVVKQLIKHPTAVDETMSLINSTFQAYTGRLMNSRKHGLVGACVYFLSAKHQLGISLADVCKVLGIKMKVINICLKQVRHLCPTFEYERPNIKDLVKKYIDEIATKHYDIGMLDSTSTKATTQDCAQKTESDPQPLVDTKDKVVLYNRVMLLIDLFEAMHPYNQPTPQSLIIAVVYHAWRSLDTFKMIAVNLSSGVKNLPAISHTESEEQELRRRAIRVKHSISFEKFCQICDLKYSSNGYKIVSKLQTSLLMLGKHLGDVNKINLPWFLKDIIENSPHLIQEHMRAEPGTPGKASVEWIPE